MFETRPFDSAVPTFTEPIVIQVPKKIIKQPSMNWYSKGNLRANGEANFIQNSASLSAISEL